MRNTLKLLITFILALCLLSGMAVCVWADTEDDEKVLAEYNRLMEAEAGDAVDAFLSSLTQPQKNRLMLSLDAQKTEKGEPATSGKCGELSWNFADGTLTVSGTGAMPNFDLVEPAPWFPLHDQIREVSLDSTITGVGDMAFLGCSELPDVKLHNGIEVIGNSAFFGCTKLDNMLLPASLKELGGWVFSECVSLTGIVIPGNVTVVEEGTFSGCIGLQSVVLNNGLEFIGANAFADCAALQNLLIPKSVSTIGQGACRNCSGLAAITVPENVTKVEADTFAGCSGLKSVTLSRSITAVEANAFRGCTGMTNISLPVALESIGMGAFSETGLTRIDIHENTLLIGSGAFENCAALKEAVIADGVKTIESRAFAGSGLAAIRFGGNAPAIAMDAFADVTAEASYPCADAKWAEVTAAVALNWKAEHPAKSQENVEATEATCTEAGCTEGSRCTVCGAMVSGGTVEPLGHDFAEGVCVRCGIEEIQPEEPVTEDAEPARTEETQEEEPAEEAEPTETEEIEQETEPVEQIPEETEAAQGTSSEEPAAEENDEEPAAEEPAEEEPEAVPEETEEPAESEPAEENAEEQLAEEEPDEEESEEAEQPVIRVEQEQAHAGQKVKLAVMLENNPGVVSMSLTVQADETCMKLVGVEDSGLLGGGNHNPEMSNPYRLTWANDTLQANVTDNGTLVTLEFEIEEDAPAGVYPVRVIYEETNYDIYDCELNPVSFAVMEGSVEIGAVLYGDVNRDGKVNNIDRALLTRYLAGWENLNVENLDLAAADLNSDGKVNNQDLIALARQLAGWD